MSIAYNANQYNANKGKSPHIDNKAETIFCQKVKKSLTFAKNLLGLYKRWFWIEKTVILDQADFDWKIRICKL